MSEQDHSVRSLAEILREHGLESDAGTRPGTTGPVRPARRRRPTEESTSGGRTAPEDDRRTSGARRPEGSTPAPPRAPRPAPPVEAKAPPSAGPKAPPAEDRTGSRFGRRRAPEPEPATVEQPMPGEPGSSTAAIPGLRTGRTTGGVGSRSGMDPVPSTGPIPKIVLPADEPEPEPLSPAQSALAWARFAGELVLAVGVGVGIYYLFTVLWELLPYAAVVAAPLAVTGLVGAATFWRRSHGQGALDTRVLLLLLFAGTLLVVVPAAGLLAGT